jgi:hypothetical protein
MKRRILTVALVITTLLCGIIVNPTEVQAEDIVTN